MSRPAAFWVAGAIAFLAFAANAAASPLYRVYKAELGFSVITLTALFAVYIVVLLVTLVFVGGSTDGQTNTPTWALQAMRAKRAAFLAEGDRCGMFRAPPGTLIEQNGNRVSFARRADPMSLAAGRGTAERP